MLAASRAVVTRTRFRLAAFYVAQNCCGNMSAEQAALRCFVDITRAQPCIGTGACDSSNIDLGNMG